LWQAQLKLAVQYADVGWVRQKYPVGGLALQISKNPKRLFIGLERWAWWMFACSSRDHELLHFCQDIYYEVLEQEFDGEISNARRLWAEIQACCLGGPFVLFIALVVLSLPLLPFILIGCKHAQ
jgi:hypothetical protein